MTNQTSTKTTKTISEINHKLQDGTAVIMTAMEFKALVRAGKCPTLGEVDVVTTATRAIMSGTSAMLTLPLREIGKFTQVKELRINGVPCMSAFHSGNTDGLAEVVINGTEESLDNNGRYGGGHVLRTLVERKPVDVECILDGARRVHLSLTLDEMPFARYYTYRNGFQNYTGFTNIKNSPSYQAKPFSIFSCRPIPPLGGVAVSGSGEMNPLENDRSFQVMRPGIRIFVNDAPGNLVGYGTRALKGHACLSTTADMFTMDPQYMGGFKTSCGVEVTSSVSVPFPILNSEILNGLAECLDENIHIPIADFSDRIALGKVPYSEVWKGRPLEVEFDFERCIGCSFQCQAEYYCPMGAISWQNKTIDQDLCVACGACTGNCLGGAFKGKGREPRRGVGEIDLFGQVMPIIFRQSNRFRSEHLALLLKERLVNGKFLFLDTDMECKAW